MLIDPDSRTCPPAEVLASYTEGLLASSEREAVAEHVSRCEDCYAVVREAVEFMAQAAQSPAPAAHATRWMPPIASWALPLAASVVLALGGLTLLRLFRHPDSYTALVGPLVDAVGEHRPFEARLTGGFRFGPLDTPVRSGQPRGGSDSTLVTALTAARHLQEREATAQEPLELRAVAVAHVLVAQTQVARDSENSLEEAERILERVDSVARSADALSDLAAVRLILYRLHGRSEALPRALEAAEKALEYEKGHPEALFNRALAKQWLNLPEAAQAWLDAAQAQPDSGWKDAALKASREMDKVSLLDPDVLTERLSSELAKGDRNELRQAIAASPWVAWEFFEDRILPQVGSGTGSDSRKVFAEAFEAHTHDETIGRVTLHPASPRLVEAHQAYSRARSQYRSDKWLDAEAEFRRAEPGLRAEGSPLLLWSELHLLILDYQKGNPSLGARADRLRARVDAGRQPLLAARVAWMRALIAIGRGRFAAAAAAAEDGEACFRTAGDVAGAAYLASLRAQALRGIGRPELAWSGIQRALVALPSMPNSTRAANVLFQASDLARSSGLPRAAHEIDLQGVALTASFGTASDRAEALLRLAQNPGPMNPDLLIGRARAAIDAVDDATVRARLQGEARWLELLARRGRGVGVAPEQWIDAARWFSDRGDNARAARSFALAGESRESAGERAASVEAYDRAFEFIAASQRIADDLGIVQAEQARKVLEGWLRGAPPEPVWGLERVEQYLGLLYSGNEVRGQDSLLAQARHAPAGERTVVLVPLEGATHAWVVGRFGIEQLHLGPLTREASLLSLIPLLATAELVSFVPLWEAAEVPLGAWVARQPGLARVRAVQVRQRLERTQWPKPTPRRSPALAVGVSAAVMDLPALPLADKEASAYAARAGDWLLKGPEATEDRVLKLLPRASLFYFAGHAVDNADRFGLSALVVSPGAEGADGYLTAAEISRLDLSHLEVAVLSACSTGTPNVTRRYARSSLAQAFLRAGARAVIGTLADVPDSEMSSAMSWIQPRLASSVDPAEAVLTMQRSQPAELSKAVLDALVVWVS